MLSQLDGTMLRPCGSGKGSAFPGNRAGLMHDRRTSAGREGTTVLTVVPDSDLYGRAAAPLPPPSSNQRIARSMPAAAHRADAGSALFAYGSDEHGGRPAIGTGRRRLSQGLPHEPLATIDVPPRTDGSTELITRTYGCRESSGPWSSLSCDCAWRGPRAPVLAAGNDALRFRSAPAEVLPAILTRRCRAHLTEPVPASRRAADGARLVALVHAGATRTEGRPAERHDESSVLAAA